MMLRCALLDDYQGVARASADWARLSGRVEIRVFREHIADRAALARALDGYEIIVAMRERTPFDRPLLEALPALRLLVTTGHRNAAIDIAAARRQSFSETSGLADRFTWCMAAPIQDGHGAINRTLCFVLPVDTPEARRNELLALLRERARGLSLVGG